MEWGTEQIIWILLSAGLLMLVFIQLFFVRRRERQIEGLIHYLTRLQDGSGALDMERYKEGSISILQSEIYKLVNLLKEQAGKADRVNQYLSDMLADISHQLKTPLTSITIMMDILESAQLSDEMRLETVSKVEMQLNKINGLIRCLLVMSQMDADVLKLKQETADVCGLLDRVCESLEVLADVKSTRIIKKYGKQQILICCDREWTLEAFINIVKNCIEHTENGFVEISVTQNNLSTNITIRDNGSGIPAEELPYIFERFYKGRNQKADSVGIGLAMADQIILKQNGIINVESREGFGTVFRVKMYGDLCEKVK